jgi:hypothetical protein
MSQATTDLAANLRDLVVRARGTGDLLPTIRRETAAALNAHRANGSSAAFFNVLLFNANPFDPCPFVFTIFRADAVTMCAGHGPPAPIVEFCDTLALTEVDALETALQGLKPAPVVMTAPRAIFEEWLAS